MTWLKKVYLTRTLNKYSIRTTEIVAPLKSFSLKEYKQLVDNSVILEQDRHGLKVLETRDGLIVKLFRRKRLLSSAVFKPYATRFVENVNLIRKLGIATVDIKQVFYCKGIKRTLVFYQPLPGNTLGSVLQRLPDSNNLFEKFIVFYADLHNKGIFFRSIHLNNVIVSEDLNTLGLIDISDMRVGSKGLSQGMRKRNFKHLTKYKADRESIDLFGITSFMDIYSRESSLSESYKKQLLEEMQRIISAAGAKK